MKKLTLQFRMVTKTYQNLPTYLPTCVTVVTLVTEVTVVTVVTKVTVITVKTQIIM